MSINKGLANYVIFHASIGNFPYVDELLPLFSKDKQDAINAAIFELAPNDNLSIEQRISLKKRVEEILSVASIPPGQKIPSIYKILQVMPTVLSFLDGKEIAKIAPENTLFQTQGLLAISQQMRARTSYTLKDLFYFQNALNLGNIPELLRTFPQTASLITHLDFSDIVMSDEFLCEIFPLVPNLTSIDLSRNRFLGFGVEKVLFTDASILALVANCPGITSINLLGKRDLTEASFRALAERLPGITSINLHGLGNLTDASFKVLVNGCQKIRSIDLEYCRNLTEISIRELAENCSDLTDINLSHLNDFNDNCLRVLADRCRGITNINLHGWAKLTDSFIKALAINCPGIKNIDLSLGALLTDDSIKALAAGCPNINSIALFRCNLLTDASITALAENCKDIREISLQGCSRITDASVIALAENCKGLKKINFSGCKLLTDASIKTLVTRCPGIESMRIASCPRFTDDTFKAITETCSKITSLSFTECYLLRESTLLRFLKKWPNAAINLHLKYDSLLPQYRRELASRPSSAVGRLYFAILNQAEIEELQERFKQIQDKVLAELFLFHFRKLSKNPTIDVLREQNKDDQIRTMFLFAMKKSLCERYDSLPKDDKDRVNESFFRLRPKPTEEMSRSSRANVPEYHLTILADALSEHNLAAEKTFVTETVWYV